MSHLGGDSIINDDEQQQQQPTLSVPAPEHEDTPMSVVQHNPGSPGPLTPTSNFDGDEEHHDFEDGVDEDGGEEGEQGQQRGEDIHEQDMVVDLLFQGVVFYLSPFLSRALADELEAALCEHGAMKTRTSASTSQIAWETTTLPTTHIISENLDIPDYKHAVARGIHIVTPEWVKRSIKTDIVQDPYAFSADPRMIFSGLCMTTTGLPDYDRQVICDALDSYGGSFSATLNSNVTHLIALAPSGAKYEFAMAHPEMNIKVVMPHWFQTCCNARCHIPETMYMYPEPPMQEVDYEMYPKPKPAPTPQLFANSVKSVVNFLNSPNENQDKFLQDKYIFMEADLPILPENLQKFSERIAQAGGFLVNEYANDMVDIVICRVRDGDLYFEASNDGKIVASLDWMYHVLRTGTMPSPTASLLHYPIPNGYIPGMSSLVMTVSNYNGPIREYIKRMIIATGATYKPELASKTHAQPTTHIICGDASGEKYAKGNEWNVKVVNHFWLEDCYLSWCMQSETKPRYGLFPLNSQLTEVFGAGLSPDLIEEWTSPDAYEEVITQPDTDEAGGETARSNVDPTTATGLLLEAMAAGDVEHHPVQPERLVQPEQTPNAVTRTSRQSSAGPSAMDDVETRQSTPSPRKATPRRGSRSTSVAAQEASSSSSHAGNDSAMPGSHSPGGVRVVSRRRGAALEATKALQQIVPDMNDFQEELRDEKRRKKRGKTAPIDDRDANDSMDVDADEADTLPNPRKPPTSPTKRKRVSMGTVVGPSTPVKSQEDTGNESENAVAAGLKTPVKRTRKVIKADKEREASVAPAEPISAAAETSEATTTPVSLSRFKHARYISTGLTKEPSAKQVKALKALGIVSTTAVDQCTHLVAKNIGRTEKFLTALAQGKIIVHEDWLQACIDANAILDESNYQIKDPENEAKFDMNLSESLERAQEKKVFEDCVIYISPSTVPKLAALKLLVEAGGGKATALLQTGLGFLKDRIVKSNQRKEAAAKKDVKTRGFRNGKKKQEEDDDEEEDEGEDNEILAVVSCEDDKDMWGPILDAGAQVYSHELIIFGILRQELDLGRTHALA
ncbi:hypothetical protein BG015_008421 [Linnemannia schmuckeri]|uniref:BRCT domain-containing protein n=1 Tax=Linnemannia schmuckeri TaxID=64567 RepID=A0A9P5S0E7_9FUNG|nr:hypothetical protein BG015_008421 [Linnemannia schmuckeri]